jgi:hypothetical protein
MEPVTIAATGGLGNQLFQFAAAVGIARATGRPIEICCRMYDRPAVRRAFVAVRRAVRGLWTDADGRFRLDAMARGPVILEVQRLARATDRRADLRRGMSRRSLKESFRDPGFRIAGADVLRTAQESLDAIEGRRRIPPQVRPLIAGFMQDDRLVRPVLDRLREALSLPERSPYLDRWLAAAGGERTVGVHVRRGDYLKPAFRDSIPVLPAAWYARAAAILRERHGDVSFLVITDEPGWARRELRLPGPTTVASADHPASAQEDLALLRACRHHVISNSTFGWWGARLARPGGTVVAPARWLLGQEADPNLLPTEWTALDNPENDR